MSEAAARRDPPGLLIGAFAAGISGMFVDLLAPLYVLIFNGGFQLDLQSAGLLVSAGLGMMTVVQFVIAGRINRLNLKLVSLLGAVVSIAALAAIPFIPDPGHAVTTADVTFWYLFVCMLVLGFGAGNSLSAGNAALSYSKHTSRAFSLLTLSYMIFLVLFMAASTTLEKIDPVSGLICGMIAIQVACVIAMLFLPDTRKLAPSPAGGEAPDAPKPRHLRVFGPLFLSLAGALTLSQLAVSGLWTYAVEIGRDTGLDPNVVNTFLGFAELTGLVGTLAPWLIGRWIPRVWIAVFGYTLVAVGIFLICVPGAILPYMIGSVLMCLGYWTTLPIGLAVAADLDANSGRLIAGVLGCTSVGLALGPLIAGPLFNGGDFALGGIVLAALSAASIFLIIYPAKLAAKLPEPHHHAKSASPTLATPFTPEPDDE